MTRSAAVAALSALFIAVLPATAEAATFDGLTSQGKAVQIVTEGKYMKRATVQWVAACDSGTNQESSTAFPSTFADTTEDGVLIAGPYDDDLGGGVIHRITTEFRAVPAGAGWRGTFKASLVILNAGTAVDRCTVAPVTFNAGTPTPPGAEKSFVGTTQQNWIVTLNTRADGVVSRVRMAWHAKCANGRTYERSTVFRNDVKNANGLRNSGSYEDRKGTGKYKGERYRVTIAIAGKRSIVAGAERWSGTVVGEVALRKKGKVFTRCKIKRMRWSADPL